MASTDPAIRHISRCSIKPEWVSEEESNQPFHLNPWELTFLNARYIQMGLLFRKPPSTNTINTIIDNLKDSLSRTLVHFFPLAGRLVTHKQDNPPSYSISIDCKNNQLRGGVDFVHAVADHVTMADILSPIHVPPIVRSFFLQREAINHDGHTLPLLAVQVTELVDGIFIACSFNHAVVDGSSLWHFLNSWAEICRFNQDQISRSPVLTRSWVLDGTHGPVINLPFSHQDEFIFRKSLSPAMTLLQDRFFHFSPQSIARLKAKANAECNTTSSTTISSFQAVSAFVWRCMTRVRCRHLPNHQKTSCRFSTNNRSRLNPPLSPDYFGSCVQAVIANTTVGELLSHGIGWGGWLLHEAVNGHTDSKVRESVEVWMKSPSINLIGNIFDPCGIIIGCSPRFDMYGCDFGWGKAEAIRSGIDNKRDGKVFSYPGRQGGGSVDFEVTLLPESMSALESDPEFMDAVSPSQ
ncbi:uncharacterized acetyltransferase At3g50280-like [Telopea speciosissima]|uniref:uncharacterized acetyltransferase At3g50280-like n=1 Tax=Telopea speciosissima TaxID=54955 RepID=UPI001CC6C7E9|nr:uncharacterized acetyltransferase At3g50280-like [Telopea speciosissima]